MFYWLKSKVVALIGHGDLYALYALRKTGYLVQMGWFESHRKKSAVDRAGGPVPWITYPSLTFLAERVRENFAVFEYGSGNSTLWWADRVNTVISCEHDPSWYSEVLKQIPDNVDLKHIPLDRGGVYCGEVGKYGDSFDIVFVDGRDRVNCVRNALSALKPDGVLVLDNSDDESYTLALTLMHENGFKRLDFVGPGPITMAVWRTSIFYRSDNCLDI